MGTTITSDLKWDENVSDLVKRANARMILLRNISQFKPKLEDMRTIYIAYIRSILEQSCPVWHFSLTQENSMDIERVQKNALKIILGQKYENYESSLEKLNLENLHSRRENLCLRFAKKCAANDKTKVMFPEKVSLKNTKNQNRYEVNFARTARYYKSAIPEMQRLLNQHE